MKKIISIVVSLLILLTITGCNSKEVVNIPRSEIVVADETNGYQSLRFTFEATDGNTYECYLSGLKIDPNNKDDDYQKMINDMAEQLLIGKRFTISDDKEFTDSYHLNLKSIDAEKLSGLTSDHTVLCWAASTSDILQYTGWGALATNPSTGKKFETEDELFDYFINNFIDKHGQQSTGFKWFINGINDMLNDPTASKQKTEYTNGLLPQYLTNNLVEMIRSQDVSIEYMGQRIIDGLNNGCAIGLIIDSYTVDDTDRDVTIGTSENVHAVTCLGYIRDVNTNELKAIFLADSDNDAVKSSDPKDLIPDENGLLPDGTPGDKKDRINKVIMFPTGKFLLDMFADNAGNICTFEHGYGDVGGLTFVSSFDAMLVGNYYRNGEADTMVHRIAIIQPCTDENKVLETQGSMDITKNVDFIPTSFTLYDSTYSKVDTMKANTNIYTATEVFNYSYVDLDPDGYFTYTISIKQNDELVDQYEGTYEYVSEWSDVRSKCYGAGITDVFTIEKPGDYEVSFEVTGIYDGSGNLIEEAYYGNNASNPVEIQVIQ